jgi:hypothetical protein
VWTIEEKRETFVDLVANGRLPGRIVEKRKGRSGVWDWEVERTVILADLKDEHLQFLIDQRSDLFDFLPMIYERMPPTEHIERTPRDR